jgi:hypothetical protein
MSSGLCEVTRSVRVRKVIDAPAIEIIDGTRAYSAAPTKLLRNRGFRSTYLGHAQASLGRRFIGMSIPRAMSVLTGEVNLLSLRLLQVQFQRQLLQSMVLSNFS